MDQKNYFLKKEIKNLRDRFFKINLNFLEEILKNDSNLEKKEKKLYQNQNKLIKKFNQKINERIPYFYRLRGQVESIQIEHFFSKEIRDVNNFYNLRKDQIEKEENNLKGKFLFQEKKETFNEKKEENLTLILSNKYINKIYENPLKIEEVIYFLIENIKEEIKNKDTNFEKSLDNLLQLHNCFINFSYDDKEVSELLSEKIEKFIEEFEISKFYNEKNTYQELNRIFSILKFKTLNITQLNPPNLNYINFTEEQKNILSEENIDKMSKKEISKKIAKEILIFSIPKLELFTEEQQIEILLRRASLINIDLFDKEKIILMKTRIPRHNRKINFTIKQSSKKSGELQYYKELEIIEPSLFLADPKDLNDPFEEFFKIFDNHIINTLQEEKYKEKLLSYFTASFSIEDHSSDMWGFYGDSGQGLIIEYNTKNLLLKINQEQEITNIFPIYYTNKYKKEFDSIWKKLKPLLISYKNNSQKKELENLFLKGINNVKILFQTIKTKKWEYEKEWRILKSFSPKEKTNLILDPFSIESIGYIKEKSQFSKNLKILLSKTIFSLLDKKRRNHFYLEKNKMEIYSEIKKNQFGSFPYKEFHLKDQNGILYDIKKNIPVFSRSFLFLKKNFFTEEEIHKYYIKYNIYLIPYRIKNNNLEIYLEEKKEFIPVLREKNSLNLNSNLIFKETIKSEEASKIFQNKKILLYEINEKEAFRTKDNTIFIGEIYVQEKGYDEICKQFSFFEILFHLDEIEFNTEINKYIHILRIKNPILIIKKDDGYYTRKENLKILNIYLEEEKTSYAKKFFRENPNPILEITHENYIIPSIKEYSYNIDKDKYEVIEILTYKSGYWVEEKNLKRSRVLHPIKGTFFI